MKIIYKMSVLIFIVLLTLLLIGKMLFITSYSDKLYKIHTSFAYELIDNYASMSRIPLQKEDYYTLNTFVTAMQSYENILYARIYNEQDRLLTAQSSKRIVEDTKNVKVVQLDVDSPYEEHLGKIEIGIDLREIQYQIMRYSWAMIGVSSCIVFITIFLLIVVINYSFLKPLKLISAAIDKLSAGDLNQTIPIHSKDELGTIAHNFNLMLRRLRDSIVMTSCILESSPSAWIAIDDEHKILECSSRAIGYMNLNENGEVIEEGKSYASDEHRKLIGSVIWDILPFFNRYKNACLNAMSHDKHIKLHREKLGDNIYFQINVFPLIGRNGIVIRVDDVTEEEGRDAQLRQSQKVESLGVLAGGLAHDFNNVLSGISSTVSILKYKLVKKVDIATEKLESFVDIIDNAANKAVDMVKQMLSLSRKQELTFVPTDLNTTINHVAKMGKNTFDKCIKIETIHYPDQAITLADPNQLESVILNLSINGWHAMTLMRGENEPQGGTLTLKLELVSKNKHIDTKKPEQLLDKNYWLISIIDTGVGISAENQKKIFEPFFTTKDKGKGTGLGLAMVWNTIEQHNGFIDIYSEVGNGTRFLIYLPETSANELLDYRNDTNTELYESKHGETILVVDDEQIVREVAESLLSVAGYKVVFAECGRRAIEVYETDHKDIAMVMIDMSMPDMTGVETFEKLKKINPDILSILCSGFCLSEKEEALKVLGVKGVMEKPYSLTKLSKLISEILYGS
jgi:signal transduction histidine kinase/CheY-like chemotaxis protein/HAMP domain-containing protein